MGSSSSKAARTAGSAARKYPQRASAEATKAAKAATSTTDAVDPASTSTSSQSGPTSHPPPQASDSRTEGIDLDARDPQFADRLSELGPVKPYPTYSPPSRTGSSGEGASSQTTRNPAAAAAPTTKSGVFPSPAVNPAVATIAARQRISEAAEREKQEAGRKGFAGKSFADIATVRKILALRDEQGMKPGDIEQALGLKSGVVARLGRTGVVEAA